MNLKIFLVDCLRDAEILQQTLVLHQLCLERVVRDLVASVGVFVQRARQILQLLVAEVHAVLVHASTQDSLQLDTLDQTVAW